MSLTLLIDLDNTLMKNDIEAFLPQYLGAFARQVAEQIDPGRFIQALHAGTQAMVNNRRPDRTLQEAFEAVFYQMLGITPDIFEPLAEKFYDQVFPTLRVLTEPKAEAARFVQACLQRGYRMAVATNPLFPRIAINQRLDWADLQGETYPFDLVASYETFHFAKPEPAFFAELLARQAWPAGQVVVIGDDLKRDVAAGRRTGLPAFWIAKPGIAAPDGPLGPSASGGLGDILPWIDSAPAEVLRPNYNQPDALVAILYSTPAALDSFCRGLSEATWSAIPKPGEWGLTEIVCHLRDVEREVNLARVRRMLGESNPFLSGEDTDPWAEARGYHYQDGPEALGQFISARLELISLLESMPFDCWQAPARHAIFGPTTLLEMVSIQAAHDRLHVQQTSQVLEAVLPPV